MEFQGLPALQPPVSAPREQQQQPIEVVGRTFDSRAAIEAALRRGLLSLSSSSVGARNEPQSVIDDRVDHQRREHQERQAALRPPKKVQAETQNQHKLRRQMGDSILCIADMLSEQVNSSLARLEEVLVARQGQSIVPSLPAVAWSIVAAQGDVPSLAGRASIRQECAPELSQQCALLIE